LSASNFFDLQALFGFIQRKKRLSFAAAQIKTSVPNKVMRHVFIIFSAAAVAFSLAACGVAYQQERSEILRSARTETFGPPPPADYRDTGEAFIKRLLKDPESARFEWIGEPRHEAIQPAFASPHATPVWVTPVRVNARNSFGGYTGFEPFALAWKNGKIVAYISGEHGFGNTSVDI